jgi:hypothetical protein
MTFADAQFTGDSLHFTPIILEPLQLAETGWFDRHTPFIAEFVAFRLKSKGRYSTIGFRQ